ncbi:MAG: STELLO glycosyltransferase family protein [Sphingobacteriales bacterium]
MENVNSYIIITSIFPPTEAIGKFGALPDYKLVVVADKKTPVEWYSPNVKLLSVKEQTDSVYAISSLLPYNHYCRKMIGYLYAMQTGASIIIDTDDDNIPNTVWNFPAMEGKYNAVKGETGFVNIYSHYTSKKIWPRGLPLRLINDTTPLPVISNVDAKVGVWQGLADEDPDVDAIYRLTNGDYCYFEDKPPLILSKGTVCPFNSQNTLFVKELFPLLYLPSFVTFRFTDILRGIVAQPIMWLYNYSLGFTKATVVQKRNVHDYTRDFESEIPMYLHIETVLETAMATASSRFSISDNLMNIYMNLLKKNIITEKELQLLECWLKDVQRLNQ